MLVPNIPTDEAQSKLIMECNGLPNQETIYSNHPINADDYQTEEKRIRFLAELKNMLNQNGGKIGYDDRLGLVDILSQGFCDKLSSSRCSAMDVLCQIIPCYGYDLDSHIGMLFPQLLQNLLHRNSMVKKSALQTLHIYFKHSVNKSMILDYLIEYGIKNEQKAIRNEVFLAIPALVRSGFSDNQLKDMFVSVLMTASNVEITESSLPIVVCLEHIKVTLGQETFKSFLDGLGKVLTKTYLDITVNSSLIRATSGAPEQRIDTTKSSKNDSLVFGFLPRAIFLKLHKDNSWQDRTDAMHKFLLYVTSVETSQSVILDRCHELLEYLNMLVDDVNFNVSLTALNIIHKVVTRICERSQDYLELILKAFIKKMIDPKVVVKKINLRIALSLMHSLTPSFYIQTILPYLKHKNTCVREEVMNTITAALLSFPSSDFDLQNLPSQIAYTLIDPKRKIRHSSLECFAILAQQLGAGKLNPLVSAVNVLESKDEGCGVLVAVQSRLHRKILPHLDENGLVKYSLVLPLNQHQDKALEPDIQWVISGTLSGIDTPKSKLNSPEVRRFSAGKKKLPWTTKEDRRANDIRKSINSAPVRQNIDSPDFSKNVSRDTWISDKPADDSKVKKVSDNTYFDIYKTRMKKFKQAGLQADATTINSVHPSMGIRNTLPSTMRNIQQFEIAYKKGNISAIKSPPVVSKNGYTSTSPNSDVSLLPLSPTYDNPFDPMDELLVFPTDEDDSVTNGTPVPVKAKLARSARKYGRQRSHGDKRKDENDDSRENSLAHTLPKAKNDVLRRLSLESPFSSRPTIHRTPSGRLIRRPEDLEFEVMTSNLTTMKSLSNSSPTISNLNASKISSPRADTLKSPNPMRNYSPIIKTPRAKILVSPNRISASPCNSPLRDNAREDFLKLFVEGSENCTVVASPRNNENISPGEPRFSNSSQEKFNKLKEDRLRQSTDSALISKKRKQKNQMSRSLDVDKSIASNNFPNSNNVTKIPLKMKHNNSNSNGTKHQDTIQDLSHFNNNPGKSVLSYDDMPINTKTPGSNNYDNDTENLSNGKHNSHMDQMKEEERLWRKNEEIRRHEDELYNEQKRKELELLQKKSSSIISSDSSLVFHTKIKHIKPAKKDYSLENENETGFTEEVEKEWCKSDSGTDLEPMIITSPLKKKPPLNKIEKHMKILDTNNNSISPKLQDSENKVNKTTPKPHPKAAQSPQTKRKTRSVTEISERELPNAVAKFSASEDLDKALDHPQQGVIKALELLASHEENWEMKCDGLITLRRLIRHHSECLTSDFHSIVDAILQEVKNLRSQVTRSALMCIADLFKYTPKIAETETEGILKIVLPKAGDTNQFIKSDVEVVLKNLSENINPIKAIAAISAIGVDHRNPLVRKVCAISLSVISEKMEVARLIASHKDFIGITSKLAIDSQPDARYHGRRILYYIRDYPNLDKLLEKHLQSSNLRPVKDILENLRNKGLPDPPNSSATARNSMRKPMRSPGMSRRSRGTSNQDNVPPTNHTGVATPNIQELNDKIKKKRRSNSRDTDKAGNQTINLDCLQKLESTSWSERYEALDALYELVSLNPAGVSANVVKVFDKLSPRLTDSNSKVNLYALQTLNRCVPILRNGMSTTMVIIIENLKAPLSSKNEAIFNMARECLITITKFIDAFLPIDNTCLVQPLVTAIQYGNARNKPEFVERLADVIMPTFARKPGVISRHVLPLLWTLLSTSASGAQTPGRANLQIAIARICNSLYECMGEELIEEAGGKGSRALQKLESILHDS